MNNQEKKAFLNRYLASKSRFSSAAEEMSRIRSEAVRITPILSDMPSGSAGARDRISRSVERLEACADKLERESEVMQKTMEEINTAILTVQDATLRQLLTLRYINGYTWEQIAVKMNYSYVHVCRLHGKALSEIML